MQKSLKQPTTQTLLLTRVLQHITSEMIILQHLLAKEWRKWADDKVSSLF